MSQRPRVLAVLFVAVVVALAAGCDAGPGDRGAGSAGGGEGAGAGGGGTGAAELPAKVLAEPSLVIGAVDASEGAELFGVVAAFRQRGGGVVVANGGAKEVLYFDADGRRVRSVGGAGEGPGEFPGPSVGDADGWGHDRRVGSGPPESHDRRTRR